MMRQFHVQTFDGPEHVTVRIVGEIDLACADLLAQALGAALATGRPVAADCAGVTFMDSAGLRVLLAAHGLAGQTRTGFRLASVTPPVHRVLDLSGTASVFDEDGHRAPRYA